jgi:hypothetical protein
MSSDPVCHAACSWVDVGSFYLLLFIIYLYFYSVSPEYYGYTLVVGLHEDLPAAHSAMCSSLGPIMARLSSSSVWGRPLPTECTATYRGLLY